MSKMSARHLFLVLAIAGVGCGNADDQTMNPPTTDPPTQTQTATYHQDIQPLMARYCTGCHQTGDIAPFSLTDYDSVRSHATQIASAVGSGLMPPWLLGDDSLPVRYSRAMRAEDKKLLLDWLAAGAPEGDASQAPRTDIPPAEMATPPRPDLVLKAPAPYLPDRAGIDDYHCFVFDPKLNHDRYIEAGRVNPDNKSIVHHAVVFLIPPDQADAVRKLDTTGSGYTCFGGPGTQGVAGITIVWAPGGTSMRAPMDTAFKLPQGALLVMQMHYNRISDNGKPDNTSIELELSDTAPKHELLNLIMAKPNLAIKAGDANSVQAQDAPVSIVASRLKLPPGDLTVYGAFPHMHLLGKKISLVTGDKTSIDIPRWDFHWQSTYVFQQPYTLKGTDNLHLECTYDNSAANQPVLGGMQEPPHDVKWGEGTLDEMCVALLLVSVN